MNEFRRLGERVAEGLGGVSDQRYEDVRVAFLDEAPLVAVRHRRHRVLLVAALLGACLLAAGGTWYLVGAKRTATPAAVAEDLWLEGPKHGAPTRVELGAGAHIDLVAGTRARVYRNDNRRTRVTLEGGVIEVLVSGEDGRNWSFLAGPYLAQTTASEFFLSYQPSAGTLEAGVSSGQLRLSGGQLASESVQLKTGQRLRAGEGSVLVGGLHDD